MESKVRVLDFNNHLLQLKSIAGVLSTLEVTAKQNGGRLDFKHPHVCGLVDGLGSSVLSTATSSAALLVSALQRGWLDLPSLLSTLVSQAALMLHYPVAVHAITNALLWEVKVLQLQKGYQCPYSLKINVHPFISMLNSRTECGWCAVSELKRVYKDSDNPCVALKMVEPFVKYVLLHPSPSSELSNIGHNLQSELISIATASLSHYHHSRELAEPMTETIVALQRCKTLLKFFIKLIPLLPTKTDRQLISVASLLEKVIHLELEIHRCDEGEEHQEQSVLIDMCFSYLCELTERGLPCHSLFEHLFSLFKNKKQGCSPHHWLVLSWLILQNLLNPQSITRLLDLCTHLHSTSANSPSTAILLCYPLVQLLAQPTTALLPFASHDIILSNQKTVSTLLKLIEVCPSNQLDITSPDVPLSCSRLYSKLISTLQLLTEFDTQKLQDITNKLNAEKEPSHGFQSNTVLALSTLALETVNGQDIDLLKGILSALVAIAKSDPSESPSLLPFFLYLQSITQNPQFKVSILYSIPSLATHRLATISIVSTIQALGATPSLLPLAIRLMDRLWQHQDHVFPFLNEMLSRVLPPSLPARLVYEVTLARAIVIRDVCQLKAELHGEEILSHISKFLLITTGDPLPIVMVIEGLVALCECEVTDVGTLWGVLDGQHHSRTLLQDNRTAVVIALCGLFELASEVDTETRHANKVFKITALKYLWNCAFSEDTKVCSAAFRAFGKFQLEDYLPEHLPPKVMAKIGFSSLADGDTSGPLCGKDCVELVHHIPVECAEAYSLFLTSIIRTELKGVQRGMIYSALREMQVPSQAERTLQSVKEALPSLCSANLTRDIKSVGLIKGSMMLEYRGEGRSGRVGRQTLSKELDQRQAMLEAFLREIILYTSVGGNERHSWMGLSCLRFSEQWKGFVGKLLDTYCQFRLLDTHSVSVEEDSKDPVFLKKKREAQDWSVSQVLDKLHSFARSNPDSAPNVLLAVTGVIDNRPAPSSEEGGQSSLLMDMVEGYTAVLLGQELPATSSASATTMVQTLLGSSHPDLPLAVVLSIPHLVDSVMALHWDGLTDAVSTKLVALISGLFEHFHGSPQWYTAVVLNQVLMKILPTVDGLRGVMAKIIPFLEASTKSNSLELLSLTAGLFPALLLYGNHTQLAKAVLSVLQQKLSSLSVSELATAPAQLCSLHLAGGAVSLFATGKLTDEEAMLVVTVLAELASNAPELAVLHLSLSIILCGLGAHGCQKAVSLTDTIAAKWIQEASELLTSEDTDDKVIPVLCGLSGFLGVNPLHSVDSNVVGLANSLSFVKTLLPLATGLLQKYVAHQDNVVCSSSVWLLSQVHLVMSDVLSHEERVPINYSYLPDDSALNILLLLLESLSGPPYHPHKIEVLKHLLGSLVACEEAQLPPADFSGLLTPLLVYRGEIEQRIIECVVHLRETQGLRQLASYICAPLVLTSLKVESKCILLENMTVLLWVFPIEHFAKFLQSAADMSIHHLSGNDDDSLLQSLLTGAVDTYSNAELTDAAKKCLSAVIVRVFTELCDISERTTTETAMHLNPPVLEKLATSLSHCDPKQVAFLCEVSKTSPVSLGLCVSSVMHCCWVRAGVRKVKTLTPVVEWILNAIDHPGIVSPLSWLLQAIVDCCSVQSSKSCEMNQSDFLHIISSWTKAAKVATSVQVDVILLMLTLVCGGSNTAIRRHMDITINVPVEQQFGLWSLVKSQSCLYAPPESHPIRDKLCLFLLDLMNVSSLSKDKFLGLISTLKSTEEFSAPLIWTSIAQWWD